MVNRSNHNRLRPIRNPPVDLCIYSQHIRSPHRRSHIHASSRANPERCHLCPDSSGLARKLLSLVLLPPCTSLAPPWSINSRYGRPRANSSITTFLGIFRTLGNAYRDHTRLFSELSVLSASL